EIYGKTGPAMWARVHQETGGKLSVDLCDETGRICLRIRGLATRAVSGEWLQEAGRAKTEHVLLRADWREQSAEKTATAGSFADQLVLLCGMDSVSPTKVESFLQGGRCLALPVDNSHSGEQFQNHALQLFAEIQRIMKTGHPGSVLIQIVVPDQGEEQLWAGLQGIIQTAHLENPRIIGQLIAVEAEETEEEIARKLKENAACRETDRIRYQDGKRYTAAWREIKADLPKSDLPWKEGGVFLITGGAGGLGLLFAREIASRTAQSTLILTGRSRLDERKRAQIKELEQLGARVFYRQVDVTDRSAVEKLMDQILREFKQLNGIIHSAGIIRDNFIIKKTDDQFLAVTAPKTVGLVNLDLASREIHLDFFIIFSSLAGTLGNAGQADYACGSAFMDAYARYRQALVERNERHGRTISFNWPLWRDGGMRLDPETEQIMQESTGLAALETWRGIRAFYEGFASGEPQVMVIAGERRRFGEIRSKLQIQPIHPDDGTKKVVATEEKFVQESGADQLRRKAIDYLKTLLSAGLKIPAGQIEADAEFMKYGIDSVMVMKLTNELEKTFGPLPKTLFFEYKTVDELTGY
ncbi:SDR family NAD(P)-dependent oxidoreductase, partial [Thermoactinomyces sp. CICC 10523]|uniref:SDR family NAD(P)-dependent oxidoreductase n=1 Tax=Thermoactinomyces sp. CICC 10523 TaxID=2767428 RepID=UPI0018DDDE0D